MRDLLPSQGIGIPPAFGASREPNSARLTLPSLLPYLPAALLSCVPALLRLHLPTAFLAPLLSRLLNCRPASLHAAIQASLPP